MKCDDALRALTVDSIPLTTARGNIDRDSSRCSIAHASGRARSRAGYLRMRRARVDAVLRTCWGCKFELAAVTIDKKRNVRRLVFKKGLLSFVVLQLIQTLKQCASGAMAACAATWINPCAVALVAFRSLTLTATIRGDTGRRQRSYSLQRSRCERETLSGNTRDTAHTERVSDDADNDRGRQSPRIADVCARVCVALCDHSRVPQSARSWREEVRWGLG